MTNPAPNRICFQSEEDVFDQKLLDCLPGVFYLYKIEPDGYKMKRMNLYHLDVFGYTEEECYDKSPLFFLDPSHHAQVLEAILELREKKVRTQVYANIITKAGESIPFLFEGHLVMIGEEEYFTGLGVDISELISAKQQLQILEMEKKRILREKELKDKELLALALKENQNEILLNRISKQLKTIEENANPELIEGQLRPIAKQIKSHIRFQDGWSQFQEAFIGIHQDFFENLKSRHPELTEMEIRFCAYLRIKMNPSDLCLLMNISKEGLKKKRYRVRQKLQLNQDQSLDNYINMV